MRTGCKTRKQQWHLAIVLVVALTLPACRALVTKTIVAPPTLTVSLPTTTSPTVTPLPSATLEKPLNTTERLAFTSVAQDESSLYVVHADGTGLHEIANTVVWPRPPFGWSPDGQRLAFIAEYQGRSILYVTGESGAPAQRLTEEVDDVEGVDWSPDGNEIVFSAIQGEDEDIYVVSLDTLALVNLTAGNNAIDIEPKWSHDGKRIAFRSSLEARSSRIPENNTVTGDWLYTYRVYVMDRDGSSRQRITEGSPLIDNNMVECHHSWSPNDRYLTFMHGCYALLGGPFNLYVYDLDTRQVSRLTAFEVTQYELWKGLWFSDDELLFYWGNELHIVNRDGTNQRLFLPWHIYDIRNTLDWTSDYQWFVWETWPPDILIGDRATGQVKQTGVEGYAAKLSPSGRWIAFTTADPGTVGNSEIWVMNREGKELHKVSGDVVGKNYNIVWAP